VTVGSLVKKHRCQLQVEERRDLATRIVLKYSINLTLQKRM